MVKQGTCTYYNSQPIKAHMKLQNDKQNSKALLLYLRSVGLRDSLSQRGSFTVPVTSTRISILERLEIWDKHMELMDLL